MDENGRISVLPDLISMRRDIFSLAISEELTKETILRVFREYGILLEPHGAVSWAGLDHFMTQEQDKPDPAGLCIALETAHPAKFPDEIIEILSVNPDPPLSIKILDEKSEKFERIDNQYKVFKEYLLDHI